MNFNTGGGPPILPMYKTMQAKKKPTKLVFYLLIVFSLILVSFFIYSFSKLFQGADSKTKQ